LIDLPGIMHYNKNKELPILIEKMVEKYISDDKTIIVCVLPANQDIESNKIL